MDVLYNRCTEFIHLSRNCKTRSQSSRQVRDSLLEEYMGDDSQDEAPLTKFFLIIPGDIFQSKCSDHVLVFERLPLRPVLCFACKLFCVITVSLV